MRISYDAEVDALSMSFCDTTVSTRELAEGIEGDYDAEGRLVGLEAAGYATHNAAIKRL